MFLHFFTFLVILALAILIFIVTILTLACSNNFVCIFLYMQRASLVGFFFIFPFFDLPFYIPFLSSFFIFPFFFGFSYFSLFHLNLLLSSHILV